jgi:tetratricopeptide (TPR) repeat protein
MTLRSGVTAQLKMSLSVFERTWARGEYWAMVALPVSQLPATAEPETLVAAVAALERLNPQAAQSVYSTALQRWPAQPLLLMGIGNASYALGDRTAAAAAYSAATRADPTSADAWNNLAQVLMEQGRRDEALQALRRALALGGPRLETYQQLERQLLAKPTGSAL